MTSDNGHLVTAEQLAEATGFPLQSIWRAARLGRIPSYRMGNLYRFDLAEVKAAMREAGPPANRREMAVLTIPERRTA